VDVAGRDLVVGRRRQYRSALRRRGFSDDDVAGIVGENFMRAFAQTRSG
jgi:microsomal dipeptidase-like Zn-dependent dipeptidase